MAAPLLHLAQRVFYTPLAIAEKKFDIILRAISHRLFPAQENLPVEPPTAEELAAFTEARAAGDEIPNGARKTDEGYCVTGDGISIIRICGTLVEKSAWADATSGLVSYASIGRQIDASIADPEVRGILLDVNSPGGETHGMFDLADRIYSLRGSKPIYAIANNAALSAAYIIASAADRIFITRTGAVGSIGVFSCHVDQSGADKNAGLKFTYVYAGEKKVDGNPHEALSPSAKRDAQNETDRQYGMFVDAVARDRGVAVQSIIDTQAGVFNAQTALPLLADDVGCFADAYQALLEKSGIILPTNTTQNVLRASRDLESMPVIPYQKTLTVRQPWSASQNRKRLNASGTKAYYSKAHAYRDADMDPGTKGAYTFIHHQVALNGTIGAANLTACSSGIGILNGGRGGQGRSTYTPGERRGIYNHLARHQKDAGETPSPLKAYREYIRARLALGLISPAAARNLHDHISALSESDPGLLAEYSFQEGDDTMPAKNRTTASADEELLRRLAKRGEAEEAEGEDAEAEDAEGKRAADATTSEPDDEDDGEDDDKDKRRTRRAEAKKGREGDHYVKKAKDKDPDDDSDEDTDDGDDEDEKDDEKKSRRAEVVRIMQLCSLAKCPERALDFVQRGYSVEKVIRILGSKRADDNNAPERSTNGFAPVKTTALQQMMSTAKNLAANKGIPIGKAYEQMLKANPSAYAAYMQEKLDATAAGPGTSMAKAYSEHIQRLLAPESGSTELLLKTNVADAAGR
jgi:signal peptide peptidase SppA